MQTALIPGSLTAISKETGRSIAESFLSVDVLIIIDMSGSMLQIDAQGHPRHEIAKEELRRLQADMPGKVGVVSFSDYAEFCPSGIPSARFTNTDMAKALRFVKPADDTGVRFILISDGAPDDGPATLAVARSFKTQINTIYIGPEGGSGQAFLQSLAAATGGRHIQAEEIARLAEPVLLLLAD